MPRTTLADVASDYVRKHQHERQCRQLDSNSRVTLTVTAAGFEKLEQLASLQRPVNDALFAPLDREAFEALSGVMRRLASESEQAIHLADHIIASETSPGTRS